MMERNGWTITVRPNDGRPTFRLIARSPEGKRAIHRDKLTAAEVEAFDPDSDWAYGIIQMRGHA